jgi:gp16 family phage-associated protein
MSKQGLTLKEWARRHGVSVTLVNAVINNKTSCSINKGHKVAVLLGLKKGGIIE